MKPFNLLSMAVIAFLVVTVVSCTTVYEGYGDERIESNRSARRIYVDPSYGQQEVYVVRDPRTGRYYQTTRPYGYDRYGYDRYGYDPYSRDYRNNRNYRSSRGNNRYNNTPNRGTVQQQPAPAPRPKSSDKIDEARRKINQ